MTHAQQPQMRDNAVHHGAASFERGMHAPHSRYHAQGKFGRLFPTLGPLFLGHLTDEQLRQSLIEVGAPGGPMDPGPGKDAENPRIPAGFVFFGQFVDHDITLDTTSSFERQNDPEGIVNFRTPALELDSVYGSGPAVTPHLYQQAGGPNLLVEQEFGRPQIPRAPLSNIALIGDPRNDENLIISQLHLAFLTFHNAVVQRLADDGLVGDHLFAQAQRIVRWHYQWIVLHEFLPLMVGKELVQAIYEPGQPRRGRRFYDWRNAPFIPVEFSVAAYRFGHSQVPGRLQVNDEFKVQGDPKIPLFARGAHGPGPYGQHAPNADPDDLSGFGLRAQRRYVAWDHLLATGHGAPQASQQIDPVLSKPLFDLPFIPPNQPNDPVSLAARNLLRGHVFGLPSGQAVAHAMGEPVLAAADLDELRPWGFERQTPLWYYLLKEAQVCAEGKQLGPVGGRIVAEVLIGLLEGDRLSFVRAYPQWKPEDEDVGTDSAFGLADLVRFGQEKRAVVVEAG